MEDSDDSPAVTSLFAGLDHIPLAISQAVAYITQTGITLTDYLRLVEHGSATLSSLLEKDCRDERRDRDSVSSVSRTWQVSYNFLQAHHPRSIDIFSLMAVLDRQNIPKYLLQEDDEDEFAFCEAVGRLTAFSLVSTETTNDTYELHRLVQLVTRMWLKTESTLQKWQLNALHRVAAAFPFSKYETWDQCASLSPHGMVVCEYSATLETSQLNHAQLLGKMGMYHHHEGKFAAALQKYQQSLSIYDQYPSLKGAETGMLESTAVKALMALGRYEEAENMCLTQLDHRRRLYGSSHASTIASMRMLANILLDKGRYVETERLCLPLLRLCENLYGAEHAYVREIMTNLGVAYRDLGSYDKAEALLRRVVDIESRVLPWPHPYRLDAMRTLAETLVVSLKDITFRTQFAGDYTERRLAKLREAKQLCDRSLPACATILGAHHLQTIATMVIMARVQFELGNPDVAEELALKALEGYSKSLGHEHPVTIRAIAMHAILWHEMGKTSKAEELFLESLRLNGKVHGHDSPNTLRAMHNLAACLFQNGKKREAVQLMSECVTLCKASLLDDDSLRLKAMATLQAWQAEIDSDDDDLVRASKLSNVELDQVKLSGEAPANDITSFDRRPSAATW